MAQDERGPAETSSYIPVVMAGIDAFSRIAQASIIAAAIVAAAWVLRDPLMSMAGKATTVRVRGKLEAAADVPA